MSTSHKLYEEFRDDPRIRTHLDDNEEERVLVYEYFMDNLLFFVKRNPDLSVETRKSILQELGSGLRDIHARSWTHLDVKPNNVMLNWKLDDDGETKIGRVVLTDLDCALKLEGEKLLNHRIGNFMWRSPEGQMGKGISKPSEVFSFGLVCLCTIIRVEILHSDFEQLQQEGTEPEHVTLYKLLSYFGPLPLELVTHINDGYWDELLTALSEVADKDVSECFEYWDQTLFPNLDSETKRVISRMLNLDLGKRAAIDEIMKDP